MAKSREKELVKNTLIITIGKVSTQLITFLLLPLYTSVLSTKEYGIVDLLNTLVLLFLPIVTLQIEQSIFRDLIDCRGDSDKQASVISNGLFIVFCQILFSVCIFFAISSFINNSYKYYLLLNLISYVFSNVFLQVARGLGDNTKYSIGSFISASSTIIFNILFLVVIKLGADGMLLGTMLGQLACAIYLFFFLNIHKSLNFRTIKKSIVKKMILYSIPLVPNAISWWIFNTSDRVIVSSMMGLSENGILSIASKFSVIFVGIYNIFNMSWTESVSLHINDSDIEVFFKKMFSYILRIFVAFFLLLLGFMPIIYNILINKKYLAGYNLVAPLLLSSLFNVIVGLISVIYIAKKDTKSLAVTSVVSAIINITTHLLLINEIGLYAAAISTLISYMFLAIYRLLDIKKKYFAIKFDSKILLESIISVLIITILYYIDNIYFKLLSAIFAISFSIFMNKDFITSILLRFKRYFHINNG